MLKTRRAYGGMVTAPHHLAAEAGLGVLKDGGNAVEAMVAMAAAIAVVYPHMNSIGGDGFWLISAPGEDVVGIDGASKGNTGNHGLAFFARYSTAIGLLFLSHARIGKSRRHGRSFRGCHLRRRCRQ